MATTPLKKTEKPEEKHQKVPLTKAFTIERGTGGWVMVEYHMRGDVVESVTRTEPDLKFAAINDFKKAAFLWWQSIG